MRHKITPEKEAFIRENLNDMTQNAIAEAIGVSQGSVSIYFKKNGLSPYWYMAKGRNNVDTITLTPRGCSYLKKRFKNTKNDILAKTMGISCSTLHRFARQMGLVKTEAFMKKRRAESERLAWEVNRRRGWPPKGYRIPRSEEFRFKKGENCLMRLGAEKEAERRRKSRESLERTRREERARATFGLPQKTNLRVKKQPDRKIRLRCYLKRRGYVIDEVAHIAYWTEDTRRAKRLEAQGIPFYSFMEMPKD